MRLLNILAIASLLAATPTMVTSASNGVVADVLTTEVIAKFSPRARADLVDALVRYRSYLTDGDINTANRLIHFMSEVATETGGMRRIDENMSYTADRLLIIFPKWVNQAKAKELAGHPVQIANWVYGGRLGNRGQKTMDGWNYRGSGYIQLTGLYNFKERGGLAGLALVDSPDLARQPKEGLKVAVAYWEKCNAVADTGTIAEVRRCVNGGKIGLAEAKMWHGKATRVIGSALAAAGLEAPGMVSEGINEELEGAKEILAQLGYFTPSGLEGSADEEKFIEGASAFLSDSGVANPGAAGGAGSLEAAQEDGLPEDLLYELSDAAHLQATIEFVAEQP